MTPAERRAAQGRHLAESVAAMLADAAYEAARDRGDAAAMFEHAREAVRAETAKAEAAAALDAAEVTR